MRLILGTGEFGWWETRLTAASLGIFCIGIFASSLIPILIRAFFALQDTKTPVVISIGSMIVNVLFSFFFVAVLVSSNFFRDFFVEFLDLSNIGSIEIIGLPLALSVAALFQLVLLLIFLYKKMGELRVKEILESLVKILIASLIMAVLVYLIRQVSADFVDMQKFWGVLFQAAFSIIVGAFFYFFIVLLLKSPEVGAIKHSFLRQFNSEPVTDDPEAN